MTDRELIQMVAFKLQETARRIRVLAREAGAGTLRAQLATLAERLERQERALREHRIMVPVASTPPPAARRPRRAAS